MDPGMHEKPIDSLFVDHCNESYYDSFSIMRVFPGPHWKLQGATVLDVTPKFRSELQGFAGDSWPN